MEILIANSDWSSVSKNYYMASNIVEVNDAYPVSDGFVVVGSYVTQTDLTIPVILKFDNDGNFIGGKAYEIGMNLGGYPSIMCDSFHSVSRASNGFITTVRCFDPSSDYPMSTLALINSNLDVQWVRSYPESSGIESYLFSAIQDGNYFVATGHIGGYPSQELEILKADSNGNLVSNKTFTIQNGYTQGYAIAKASSYVIAGVGYLTQSSIEDALLLKVDDSGCIQNCPYCGDVSVEEVELDSLHTEDVSLNTASGIIALWFTINPYTSVIDTHSDKRELCRSSQPPQPIPEFSELGMVVALAAIAMAVGWKTRRVIFV